MKTIKTYKWKLKEAEEKATNLESLLEQLSRERSGGSKHEIESILKEMESQLAASEN